MAAPAPSWSAPTTDCSSPPPPPSVPSPPPSSCASPARLTGRGATFAGRDVFAPAAARPWPRASTCGRLGRRIDPASLAGTAGPGARRRTATAPLRAEVLWVDRFGNAQLNARPADADHLGPAVDLRAGPTDLAGPPGARPTASSAGAEVGLVTDSYGLLSVSCRGASAAARTGLGAGDEVWLGRPASG